MLRLSARHVTATPTSTGPLLIRSAWIVIEIDTMVSSQSEWIKAIADRVTP
ncbi:MAG TPA: hypothetical protein VFR18_13255 [Terriglobia bacterium]|nr:hypothetical protein [Terriglobia bacterium]